MKRIVVFILTAIVLVSPLFAGEKSINLEGVTDICIISKLKVETQENCEVLKNGNIFYYTFKTEDYSYYQDKIEEKEGINLYYNKKTTKEDLIKKHNITNYYLSSVDGITILYGYTNNYNSSRLVGGKKINVQIAWNDTQTIVGFPLILTGF